MELDKIEKLLEKYFEASTSVAEEETLKTYFSQEHVAKHLEQYSPMFQYFSGAKEEKFTKEVALESIASTTEKRKFNSWWLSVAAVALLMFGIYFGKSYVVPTTISLENEYTQEEITQAQEAFKLLAVNFNKGTKELTRLSEFEKSTNKFLIKE